MGLQDSDSSPLLVPDVFQAQLRPGFLRLAVAHVKDGDLAALSNRHATVARDGVMSTAAVPLARVDFEVPHKAPEEDKGASLVVFVTPVHRGRTGHSNLRVSEVIWTK